MKSQCKEIHLRLCQKRFEAGAKNVILNATGNIYEHQDLRYPDGKKAPEAYEEMAKYGYPADIAMHWVRFDNINEIPRTLKELNDLFDKQANERLADKNRFIEKKVNSMDMSEFLKKETMDSPLDAEVKQNRRGRQKQEIE